MQEVIINFSEMKFLVKVTIKKTQCNSLFSQYPFFPCPLLFCIVFSRLGMGGGVQEAWNSLQQSLDTFCLVFKVPCRSSPPYYSIRLHSTITKLHSSSCSVAVCSFNMSVHSSIFKKRSTSSTKILLSSFHC